MSRERHEIFCVPTAHLPRQHAFQHTKPETRLHEPAGRRVGPSRPAAWAASDAQSSLVVLEARDFLLRECSANAGRSSKHCSRAPTDRESRVNDLYAGNLDPSDEQLNMANHGFRCIDPTHSIGCTR